MNFQEIRIVPGSSGQADRDAGAEVRWRQGEKRGADDPARVQEVHAAEEIRGDNGDGEGREETEQKPSGGFGPSGKLGRSRQNGLSQPDLHTAAAVVGEQQADADKEYVAQGEKTRREFAVAATDATESERQVRDPSYGRSSGREPGCRSSASGLQLAPERSTHTVDDAEPVRQASTTSESLLGLELPGERIQHSLLQSSGEKTGRERSAVRNLRAGSQPSG